MNSPGSRGLTTLRVNFSKEVRRPCSVSAGCCFGRGGGKQDRAAQLSNILAASGAPRHTSPTHFEPQESMLYLPGSLRFWLVRSKLCESRLMELGAPSARNSCQISCALEDTSWSGRRFRSCTANQNLQRHRISSQSNNGPET
ncbi:hypothetical protein EYF80_002491 [Liparis tanakae]|uniref:Uncharacterized protein n=1 Tax=Liparis tanakae TaxID=230148 RepID=A0A4Z2JAQ0_9TELE|nr:hypothetical protein EYF80_002491 [Liparis tanakae]